MLHIILIIYRHNNMTLQKQTVWKNLSENYNYTLEWQSQMTPFALNMLSHCQFSIKYKKEENVFCKKWHYGKFSNYRRCREDFLWPISEWSWKKRCCSFLQNHMVSMDCANKNSFGNVQRANVWSYTNMYMSERNISQSTFQNDIW